MAGIDAESPIEGTQFKDTKSAIWNRGGGKWLYSNLWHALPLKGVDVWSSRYSKPRESDFAF